MIGLGREKAQIAKRLTNIEEHGNFGTIRDLGDFLSELKWVNGRRVYYSVMEDDSGDLTLLYAAKELLEFSRSQTL